MNLLIYIIKSVFISGLLLGYYGLFLRNRLFHGFNRFFLLYIPVFSLIIPVLHFNLPAFWIQTAPGSPIRLLGVGRGTLEEAVTIYGSRQRGNGFTWEFISMVCSGLVSFYLSARLYQTIRYLRLLRKRNPFLQLPEATVYFVSEKGTPFSFFKSIFWGKEMDMNSASGKQILRHELFHVKQRHSLDILLLEILSILMWFNPFLHFIRRELKAIHEYSADAYAAGTDTCEYASLLLLNVTGSSRPLTNPFFKNQIKRRIHMMTKPKKHRPGLLGRFMILPLAAILICLFSFKMQNHFHSFSNQSIRVVIDAGHGGVDPGTSVHGIPEKNINLAIAKKIQQLSAAYHVDVIMTRENDELPGKGDNIGNSLKYRAELPGRENADLFISIHTNGTGKNEMQHMHSGFDIYVPVSTSKVYDGSVKLGSMIADQIKPDYTMAPELKQGNVPILVLDHAIVPSILIECGYIDNQSDLAYMQNEENQEKIARDILEGIRKYGLQATRDHTVPQKNTVLSGKTASGLYVVNNEEQTENTKDSTAPLKKVEVESEYPGGNTGWGQYLFNNLNYPTEAETNEIQGDVVVEFVVRKNGSLTNIHALSGPVVLRAESVRVIAQSGKWIPAMDHGTKVDSYRRQPIHYRLKQG